jgi:hypothetical protein
MNPKLVGAAVLAALAVAIVVFIVVLPSPPPPAAQTATETPAVQPDIVSPPGDFVVDFPTPDSPSGPSSAPVEIVSEEVWTEQLDNLLGADEDNSATARKLVAALSGLPPAAQEEYVAHAVNLCEDEDFAQLEAVYLAPGTPPEVIETIFNDALNRSDEIKLPMLVKTLRQPAHPMAGEAKEILEMYLDIDPDSPAPVAWEQEVQRYLREEAGDGQ